MKWTTVHTWFESIASQYPEQVAIEEGSQATTYAHLCTQAKRLAQGLIALEPSREGVIGVLLPSGTDLVVALLASFYSGRLYLPLDQQFAPKRLQQILAQCQPRVLVTSKHQLEAVQALLAGMEHTIDYLVVLAGQTLRLYRHTNKQFHGADWAAQIPWNETPSVAIQSTDPNYIFYTSGSTGTAKAILGVHQSLAQFIDWEITEFGLSAACRVSQLVQPTFDASLRDIFVPLCTGGTLCIPSEETRSNASELAIWLDKQKVTLVHTVPSLFRLLTKSIEKGQLSFPQLAYVLISGEALYGRDVQQWRDKAGTHVQLVNLYGATETTMIRTFHRIGVLDEDLSVALPVGKPIAQTAVAIINDGHHCRPGEIGEIYIKTPFWTKGYLFDTHLNSQVFVQNPLVKDREDLVYKTGDLGRYLKDQTIQVLGRMDNQVKVNGIRVELEEIEQAIRLTEGIDQVLVTSHINRHGDTELIAYYTGQPRQPEAWQKALQYSLSNGVRPTYFQHMDAFPLTLNGKIDKKALPQPEALRLQEHPYEPVQTPTEQKLEQMWQAILDVPRIGRSVSFFAIGGNSLKAIQLIARIYKEFQILLKVMDIFTYPTIAWMATLLAQLKQKKYAEITPVTTPGPYPATWQQRRLWIMDQLDENQLAYHMPMAFELTGLIQQAALVQAFYDLVRQHESLRTVFEQIGDTVFQKIQTPEETPFTVEVADMRTHTNPEEAARQYIFQVAERKMDLSKGPLIHALLLQIADDRHLLFINTHHIISDAWSMNVMARDVLVFYRNSLQSAPQSLSVQYRDYSAWINAQLAETADDHRNYWLGQMEGELPVLQLPTDFSRPKKQTFQGSKYFFQWGTALSQSIHASCQQHDITLFMYLLSSVNTLLYYYSGQKDILLGVPLAGRMHQALEDQVGFYVNVVALRTIFDPTQPFTKLLEQVKTHTLAAYEHGIYPFDQLVEELQVGADRSRSSLFDVMVQMQDTQVKDLNLLLPDGIALSQLELDFQSSKFDLTFNFEAIPEGNIIGWVEYNTDLFLPDTIQRMVRVLQTLIQEVTETDVSLITLKKTIAEQMGDVLSVEENPFSHARLSEEF